MAREILTVTVDPRNALNPFQRQGDVTPVSFYQAKQLKPENLAAGTARIFLGVRIECASATITPSTTGSGNNSGATPRSSPALERDAGTQQQGMLNSIRELFDRRELVIPGTGQLVKPTHLDGAEPKLKFRESAGDAGRLDDRRPTTPISRNRPPTGCGGISSASGSSIRSTTSPPTIPPSHPELLDLLAREFAAQKFDFKFLIACDHGQPHVPAQQPDRRTPARKTRGCSPACRSRG